MSCCALTGLGGGSHNWTQWVAPASLVGISADVYNEADKADDECKVEGCGCKVEGSRMRLISESVDALYKHGVCRYTQDPSLQIRADDPYGNASAPSFMSRECALNQCGQCSASTLFPASCAVWKSGQTIKAHRKVKCVRSVNEDGETSYQNALVGSRTHCLLAARTKQRVRADHELLG